MCSTLAVVVRRGGKKEVKFSPKQGIFFRVKGLLELPREVDVEKALRKHLKEHGYAVTERTRIRGVDVVAMKDGKTYYVEIEGKTKPDGKPMITSQKYTHLLRAVGQICLRMNDDPNGIYELVLAEDKYYRKKVAELHTSLKKLGVETYFLDLSRNVRR